MVKKHSNHKIYVLNPVRSWVILSNNLLIVIFCKLWQLLYICLKLCADSDGYPFIPNSLTKTTFGQRTSRTVCDGYVHNIFLSLWGRQVPRWHDAAFPIHATTFNPSYYQINFFFFSSQFSYAQISNIKVIWTAQMFEELAWFWRPAKINRTGTKPNGNETVSRIIYFSLTFSRWSTTLHKKIKQLVTLL